MTIVDESQVILVEKAAKHIFRVLAAYSRLGLEPLSLAAVISIIINSLADNEHTADVATVIKIMFLKKFEDDKSTENKPILN